MVRVTPFRAAAGPMARSAPDLSRRRFVKRCALMSFMTVLPLAVLPRRKAGARPASEGGGKIRLYSVAQGGYVEVERVVLTEKEWKARLTPRQFHILREEGTEGAFTGRYWDNKEDGIYRCAGCGNDLFSSAAKYRSGTGWPSFWEPVAMENVVLKEDYSFFMRRTEVVCARCDGHQGHVFDDGPPPTGLRYCINSASLSFVPEADL